MKVQPDYLLHQNINEWTSRKQQAYRPISEQSWSVVTIQLRTDLTSITIKALDIQYCTQSLNK